MGDVRDDKCGAVEDGTVYAAFGLFVVGSLILSLGMALEAAGITWLGIGLDVASALVLLAGPRPQHRN